MTKNKKYKRKDKMTLGLKFTKWGNLKYLFAEFYLKDHKIFRTKRYDKCKWDGILGQKLEYDRCLY
jgi:hypothetical protein